MPPDMSFSATSLESLIEDGSTDSDDYSSVSDDDILHIGFSSRPQLPFFLSHTSISKGVFPGLAGSIVSQTSSLPPRNQPAHLRPTRNHKPVSNFSSKPLPPPPPPPPPLLPPLPLTRTKSGAPSRSLSGHHRRYIHTTETRRSHDEECHENNGDSFSAGHPTGLQSGPSYLFAASEEVESRQADLQKLRQSRDEADREFMAAARELVADYAQLRRLQQLFEAMQETRMLCQEAEQHLEAVVIKPYHSQEKPESQEDTFYETATGPLKPTNLGIDGDRDGCSDKSEDWALRGITGDRPEAIHPLYAKLRAAFGKLQLARELHINTQMKRELLHARKSQPLMEDSLDLLETYGDVGKKKALELRATTRMTEEDIEQLREYNELEQDAKHDIEIYTEMVRVLLRECKENGALPSTSYFQQEGFGIDSFGQEEIPLAPSPPSSDDEFSTLAHPVFPLLLSNPSHLLDGFPRTAMQFLREAIQLQLDTKQVEAAAREVNMHSLLSDCKSAEKSEYINRWMLHKLHHSAMEAELLLTTFRSRLEILDMDRWQRDVPRFWWHDEPGAVMPESSGDNDTEKASKFVSSRVDRNMCSYSDSGQLDAFRNWNLDDSWS